MSETKCGAHVSRSDSRKDRARNDRFRALFHVQAILALSAILLILSGCLSRGDNDSRTSGSDNHPPVVKLIAILPSPLTLSGPLATQVEAQDPDLNTVEFRYRWMVNGTVITGQTRESFPPELLKRGDQVMVEVTPFDGMIEGAPLRSSPVSVVNTAPIMSDVGIDFDHQAQGRRLLAKVNAVDPDNDPVSLTYRWRKNETVLKEGEENTLDVSGLTAKDTILVEVTASDGSPDGATTVKERFTLTNSAPTIVSKPSSSTNGDQYDYLVQATDADGDPIIYELDMSPPGMTIEANTGRIHWTITPEAKGSYRIKVVAKDPQGGFAMQEFDLSVNARAQT
jgi:hypothetical protein